MIIPSKNVLLVDDNDDLTFLISTFLEFNNVICTVASTIVDAVAKINNTRFDFIILDLLLPDGYGLDLLPAVALSESADAKVIISSGNGSSEIQKNAQIIAILIKPYDPDELLNYINKA